MSIIRNLESELKEIQSPGTEESGSLMLSQNTGSVLG